MKRYSTVDEYIAHNKQWQSALILLRDILNSCELEETVKWGAPAYTVNGKNVIGMAGFKSYVGLWFFQGVFLKDPKKVLINAQMDKTKGLRQWRFENIEAIESAATDIEAYINEAIENQKAGKEIKAEKKALEVPKELQDLLDKDPSLKTNYESLTLSKKREYADHIASAKREETKLSRLEKIEPMIRQGVGLHDKYRK